MKPAVILAFGVLAPTRLSAHHFAAETTGQTGHVTGTVAKIDGRTPTFISTWTSNDAGAVTQWKFEGYPPNMLIRQGWKRDVTMKLAIA
jgi:hypothetical protein